MTLTYLCTDLQFLCEYFIYLSAIKFTPIIRVLVTDTIIGHVNMYLVKINSQKLLTSNQFLVITIFFTIMNVSLFSLRFDLFSIIAKEVNQIRNNVVCVIVRLVFLFCCALTTGRCSAFHHIFVN